MRDQSSVLVWEMLMEIVAMTSPPALRPPAWAEKYRWHWLSGSDGLSLWEWKGDVDVWLTIGCDVPVFPHWFTPDTRYCHPADPSARVIDPENEAMVECVVRAIWEVYRQSPIAREGAKETSWDDIVRWAPDNPRMNEIYQTGLNEARAVLVALKEMP